MARDYGGDIMKMYQQMLLQKLMLTPEEKRMQELRLQQAETGTAPLQNYENIFQNRWSIAERSGNLESVAELGNMKKANTNLYNTYKKNITGDKLIPITEAYDRNQRTIKKQIERVGKFASFETSIDTMYGDLEVALFHNMKTLDQLGDMHLKGFDNWEDVYTDGSTEDIAEWENVTRPYLKTNGEKITELLVTLSGKEKQLTDFTGFKNYGLVARNFNLLKKLSSGLSTELKSKTLLTDLEARAISDTWKSGDIRIYENFKVEQKKGMKTDYDLYKADLIATKKYYAKLENMVESMKALDKADDDLNAERDMSFLDMKNELKVVEKRMNDIRSQMRGSGEVRTVSGTDDDFDLTPTSQAAIDAMQKGTLGIPVQGDPTWDRSIHAIDSTPVQRNAKRAEMYNKTPEEIGNFLNEYGDTGSFKVHGTFDEYLKYNLKPASGQPIDVKPKQVAFNVDTLIDDYMAVYTKTGFNITPEGIAFKEKNNLTHQSMTQLSKIGQINNANYEEAYKESLIEIPRNRIIKQTKQHSITQLKKTDEALRTVGRKYFKAHSENKKIPDKALEAIKKAIPDIDTHIATWRKQYSSKVTRDNFNVWIRRMIKAGNIPEIEYEELKGLK